MFAKGWMAISVRMMDNLHTQKSSYYELFLFLT